MHLSEILYQLGEDRENYYNAVSTPVIQTSNFAFTDLDDFRHKLKNELSGTIYTRGNNPTVKILRQKIAALESAEEALIFASGAAAVSAAVIANVNAGDHIVCVKSPYSWTNVLLTRFLTRFGVTTTFVDGTDAANFEKAIQPDTKVIFLESPNSQTFELQDLAACADICKRHGLISIIDNSYSSPIYQRPIEFGIDIVVHSATKYLNGHSDVVAGVVCSTLKMIQKIFDTEQMCLGAIISPHDANLIIRGLRTLPLRIKRSDESAKKVIEWLKTHPKVKKIYHPFQEDSPQYELAKKQMSGCGGLFSIETTAETIEEAEAFFYRLKRFVFAVSWGGHESLIFPICSLYGVEGKSNPSLPFNFYRFYIGLEEPEWLIEDLKQAFDW
jgi:cystathionine beta-lyase/cystathionine gamma-synthase